MKKSNVLRKLVLASVAYAMLSIVPATSNAFLIDQSAPVSSGARDDFTGTIGNRFRVGASDITLNRLGYEDSGADGLTLSHQVGIWSAGGTLLTSATVAAGTGADLLQIWRFVEIPDIVLLANTDYYVGASVNNGFDAWTDVPGSSGFSYGSGVGTPLGTPLSGFSGAAFGVPNADGGTELRWSPANATFVTTFDEVPEPGTLLVFAFGLAGLTMMRRKRLSA